ncbi:type II secretion system protein [Kiritimatiellota bacterium B12222]|nr:type II secretion system protein [Kiritimatiellota bacterium B12222]
MKNQKRKEGFTLVEIMIVVMIIGLLAAIALPGFTKARKTAQKNACIENLRQINSASQQYMIEYKEANPPAFGTATFLEYFQTEELPECPAGGSYTQATAGDEMPTCNLSADGHEL